MGRRDFGRREAKKPRKDTKKKIETIILQPSPPPVEVVKRGKKAREEEWEE